MKILFEKSIDIFGNTKKNIIIKCKYNNLQVDGFLSFILKHVYNNDIFDKVMDIIMKFKKLIFILYKYKLFSFDDILELGFSEIDLSIHLDFLYKKKIVSSSLDVLKLIYFLCSLLDIKINLKNFLDLYIFLKKYERKFKKCLVINVLQINLDNLYVDFYIPIDLSNEKFMEIAFKNDSRLSIYFRYKNSYNLKKNRSELSDFGFQVDLREGVLSNIKFRVAFNKI